MHTQNKHKMLANSIAPVNSTHEIYPKVHQVCQTTEGREVVVLQVHTETNKCKTKFFNCYTKVLSQTLFRKHVKQTPIRLKFKRGKQNHSFSTLL